MSRLGDILMENVVEVQVQPLGATVVHAVRADHIGETFTSCIRHCSLDWPATPADLREGTLDDVTCHNCLRELNKPPRQH